MVVAVESVEFPHVCVAIMLADTMSLIRFASWPLCGGDTVMPSAVGAADYSNRIDAASQENGSSESPVP